MEITETSRKTIGIIFAQMAKPTRVLPTVTVHHLRPSMVRNTSLTITHRCSMAVLIQTVRE